MSSRRLLWIAPLLAIGAIAGVVAYWGQRDEAPPQALACEDLQEGCTASLDGHPVTVGFIGHPRVLKPFEVWVRAEGAKQVQARFVMEGMDMGFNLYTLRADDQGVFRARITLPVCVSGRRDWRMTLEVDGRRLEVPFVTEMS